MCERLSDTGATHTKLHFAAPPPGGGGYMKTRFLTCSRKPDFGIIPKTRFQDTPQNPIFRPANFRLKIMVSKK